MMFAGFLHPVKNGNLHVGGNLLGKLLVVLYYWLKIYIDFVFILYL